MLVAVSVTCIYHIAKHENPFSGGGEEEGEEGTDRASCCVTVILAVKRKNQLVIGVERGKIGGVNWMPFCCFCWSVVPIHFHHHE